MLSQRLFVEIPVENLFFDNQNINEEAKCRTQMNLKKPRCKIEQASCALIEQNIAEKPQCEAFCENSYQWHKGRLRVSNEDMPTHIGIAIPSGRLSFIGNAVNAIIHQQNTNFPEICLLECQCSHSISNDDWQPCKSKTAHSNTNQRTKKVSFQNNF